jgi:hypothetical protein
VARNEPTRLIVAMDATASRQSSWDTARQVMDAMFREVPEGLAVQVVWYDGQGMHCSPWSRDAASLLDIIGGVACSPGKTKILKVLQHAADSSKYGVVSGLVLVGDAWEEPAEGIEPAARRLRLLGCPAFVFQEGTNPDADEAFRAIARITGGAVLAFDADAPDRLHDILGGVAAYAKGGVRALEAAAKRLPGAVALLSRMTGGK